MQARILVRHFPRIRSVSARQETDGMASISRSGTRALVTASQRISRAMAPPAKAPKLSLKKIGTHSGSFHCEALEALEIVSTASCE